MSIPLPVHPFPFLPSPRHTAFPRATFAVYRLAIHWAVGLVGLRDFYALATDPSVRRLGSTGWITLAVVALEIMIVVKFGFMRNGRYIGKLQDAPAEVVWGWGAALLLGVSAAMWWFLFERPRRSAAATAVVHSAEESDAQQRLWASLQRLQKTRRLSMQSERRSEDVTPEGSTRSKKSPRSAVRRSRSRMTK